MLLEQNMAVQAFQRGIESEKSEINRAALQLSDHPRMSRFADRDAHAWGGFSDLSQQRHQDRILSVVSRCDLPRNPSRRRIKPRPRLQNTSHVGKRRPNRL